MVLALPVARQNDSSSITFGQGFGDDCAGASGRRFSRHSASVASGVPGRTKVANAGGRNMASENLQMHELQPHPEPASGSPPTEGQAQPVAGPQDRGMVFKTRYPSACKECRRRKQKVSLIRDKSEGPSHFSLPSIGSILRAI